MSDSARTNETIKAGISTIGNTVTGGKLGTAINTIGGIMSLFGGGSAKKAAAQQFQNQMALQQQAQEWSEYMYRNRYQMQREDLEKAGINPLFGLGNAPATALGGGSAGMPEYVQEKQNKQQMILQGIQLGQEFSAKQAQIKNLDQQTETEKWTSMLEAQNVIGKQLENLYQKKELNYYDKQRKKELEKLSSEINESMERQKNIIEERRNLKTARKNIEIQNEITGREAQWIKNHPMLSGFGIGADKVGRPIMEAVGLGIQGYSAIKGGKTTSAKRAARGANR